MLYKNVFLGVYDSFENKWQSLQKSKFISNIVIFFFIVGIVASLLSYFHIIDVKLGKFFAIELAFSVLLFVEVFDLFFIITHSVADSVGKQFEIISLILLRDAFKELGHLSMDVTWDLNNLQTLLPIIVDALGAVIIFLITVLFYNKQRHIKITKSEEERSHFIFQKKVVASFMIVFFIVQIAYSCFLFFSSGTLYKNMFNQLYTGLIFSDILILILSLRYSNLYVHLFRYSSFALATVILRLSLSAPKYYNVLLSVSAGVFVLLVSFVYNFLNKKAPDNLV
jgi:hypothetical protein